MEVDAFDESQKKRKIQMSESTNEPYLDEMTLLEPSLQNLIYLDSNYTPQILVDMDSKVGQGSFSTIRSGLIRTKEQQWEPVVLKISKENKHDWDKIYREDYLVEVQALLMLKGCRSVVRVYGAFYERVENSKKLWIIQQKCLFSLDHKKKEIRRNPSMIVQVFQQLLFYLDYAHNLRLPAQQPASLSSKDRDNLKIDIFSAEFCQNLQNSKNCHQAIIHKDLKPANILIRSLTQQKIQIAIADFGMAMFSKSSRSNRQESFGGSANYYGPQMIKKRPFDSRTDCWCFGLIIYDLLGGTRLKGRMKSNERLQSIKDLCRNLSSNLSNLAINKIMREIIRVSLNYGIDDRLLSRELRQLWQEKEHRTLVDRRRLLFCQKGQQMMKQLTTLYSLLGRQFVTERSMVKEMLLHKLEQQIQGIVSSLMQQYYWTFQRKEIEQICQQFTLNEPDLRVELTPEDISSFFQLEPYPQYKLTYNDLALQKIAQILSKNPSFPQQLKDKVARLCALLSSEVQY